MPPYGHCDPHSTHRPLENEEEQDNARVETTPIVREKQNSCQPGTSSSSYDEATCQQRVSDDQDSGHSVPKHVKGNGKEKKKIIPFVANDIQIHCEDREGNFKVPLQASNSSFSVEDEKSTLVNENDGYIEDEYVPPN